VKHHAHLLLLFFGLLVAARPTPASAQPTATTKLTTTTTPGSTTLTQFPATDYLAEDIDYDPTTNTFLFTSILHHAVYRLTPGGKCREFARSPSNWPLMAIKIDHRHHLVYATEVALPGFDGIPDTAIGRSALCCFDLKTGKLKQRFEAPGKAQWGDMVLDAQGNPIVCDGRSGAIYRLDQSSSPPRQSNSQVNKNNSQVNKNNSQANQNIWQRLDKGDLTSPQTPTVTSDGKHLIIPDYERGLALMTIATGEISWIKDDSAHPCTLTGIDGVYLQDQSHPAAQPQPATQPAAQPQLATQHHLFVTQNGVQPERVLQINLDNTNPHVTGCTLIEPAPATPSLTETTSPSHAGSATHGASAMPPLGEPTHGVLAHGNFYYIANSGWDVLDRHGIVKPGARMTPPRLMRYRP